MNGNVTPSGAHQWDTVFDRITVRREGGWWPIPPATDEELNALEEQFGCPLPLGYRAFLNRFGPGTFDGYLRVFPVAPVMHNYAEYNVADWTKNWRLRFAEWFSDDSFWIVSAICFGCDAGGNNYVWNPTESSHSGDERPVYWLPNHTAYAPERLASSFVEFLEWEFDQRHHDDSDEDEQKLRPLYFDRCPIRQKERPAKRVVSAWLAHNGGTVRALARSIRNGHTDALPILADALEDAGCANADVLDSCRTGDPALDGVWVLDLLLGPA